MFAHGPFFDGSGVFAVLINVGILFGLVVAAGALILRVGLASLGRGRDRE
jgi:hypothetical protein